jgi:XTP/dITP diphosphohydrolase
MSVLVLASNNPHKLQEIRQILGHHIIASLSDIGCHEELPETHDTLEGNSLEKAQYVFDRYGRACLADDTGLEIEALGGAPGVYSARYTGEQKSSSESIERVLDEMRGFTNRSAMFRAVIALVSPVERVTFDGVVSGSILTEPRGKQGFGYDPIFVPEGYSQTFAEMSDGVKNSISHRARAIEKLVRYLEQRKT